MKKATTIPPGVMLGITKQVMDLFVNIVDKEVSVASASSFLLIMTLGNEFSIGDLAKFINRSHSASYNLIQRLGDGYVVRGKILKGYGLIESVQDRYDSRRKIVRLTPKGKSVADAIITLVAASQEKNS